MKGPLDTWSLDREIVLTRLFSHPPERVFAAWTNPAALAEWYGPAGLKIETHEADIREGGLWRFDMVGLFEGEERRFPNLMCFLEIVPSRRIVANYGTPEPGDPERFRMTITFDEQPNGGTLLTLRQLHPTRERREAVIAFGAVGYGLQTLHGLSEWLAR